MENSDSSPNDSGTSQLFDLQSIIHRLNKEKTELEKDFGLKRAKFKELYLQKEDELQREREEHLKTIVDITNLKEHIKNIQTELDECRSLLIVFKYQKENEVETERQRCQEEIASLQHILREAVADAIQTTSGRFEKEIKVLKKVNEKLENELMEYRSSQGKDREGVLSVMTKSLRQKVGGLSSPIPFTTVTNETTENLEESMKKAQEDAEMLRSLVMPLEEEIKALKDKLRATDTQLQISETTFVTLVQILGAKFILNELQNNASEDFSSIKEKVESNQYEPNSMDQQMYVSFLYTQNSLLQANLYQFKQEMQQVQGDLLKEQKDHFALKKTWQIVNDQFLEAQRVHKREMRILHNMLTPNQQRRFSQHSLKSKAKESTDSDTGKILNKYATKMSHRRLCSADNKCIESLKDFNSPNNQRCLSAPENLSDSTQESQNKPSSQIANFTFGNLRKSCSLNGIDAKTARDLYAVDFIAPRTFFNLDACSSSTHTTGSSNNRLHYGKSCDMCSVYKHQVEQFKMELHSQKTHSHNLEREIKIVTQEYQIEVDSLKTKHGELIILLSEQKSLFDMISSEIYSQLKELTMDREATKNEIKLLQHENKSLLGKHLIRSHQLHNEVIDLPDNLEEMQFICLKLREELITALVSREKIEDSLRTENLFLEEQLISEQNTKASLTSELNNLREHNSEKPAETRRLKFDEKFHGKLFQSNNSAEMTALQGRIETLWQKKMQLEDENQELKSKIISLQSDLEISEGVQRDFVKLSQTLQMELEKIRQQVKEVRWQHEDDVSSCNTCKESFDNTSKEKHHCCHCGQIFCSDCLPKTVYSGPNKREFKVCNVCHTLLDHTSAPYFSDQPLNSPL